MHRYDNMSREDLISTLLERDKKIEKLQDFADYDGLTRLLRREMFQERLNRLLARHHHSATGNVCIAVLVIDLNRFKWINDTFGHPVGDEVLRKVADAIHLAIRPDDIAGRLGGDEIVIALQHVRFPSTRVVAGRIAARLSELSFSRDPVNGGPQVTINVTASMGGVLWNSRHPVHADELIKQADTAAMRAKHAFHAKGILTFELYPFSP